MPGLWVSLSPLFVLLPDPLSLTTTWRCKISQLHTTASSLVAASRGIPSVSPLHYPRHTHTDPTGLFTLRVTSRGFVYGVTDGLAVGVQNEMLTTAVPANLAISLEACSGSCLASESSVSVRLLLSLLFYSIDFQSPLGGQFTQRRSTSARTQTIFVVKSGIERFAILPYCLPVITR